MLLLDFCFCAVFSTEIVELFLPDLSDRTAHQRVPKTVDTGIVVKDVLPPNVGASEALPETAQTTYT